MHPTVSLAARARRAEAFAAALVLPHAIGSPVAASPFSPTALDSSIVACMEQIDPDSLESYIATMQGFFTRHTNSDTTSATTGIGAARRWVHDKFVEFANQGGNLEVSYHTFTTSISSLSGEHRNVLAEIPGTATGADARIYLIGGHLDSRNGDLDDVAGFAPGADDDASGVACALELARVMSLKSWPMTLRFAAWTGEEQGLYGSQFYAREARLLGEPIAGMIANDVMASIVGAPDPDSTAFSDTTLARAFSTGPEDSSHRQLARYLKAMGDAYVPIQDIVLIPAEDRPSRGSDHQSFVAEGFTAMRYMEYLEELYRQHSADGDTLGAHLSMSYLRRNAQVDLVALAGLALSPASPVGLAVADVGDSTGFRLQWPGTNPEPDLDAYLVTMRSPGALDYEAVFDVGLANELVIASPPGDSLYFGLSVRNTAGHRALVGGEVLGVLSSVPLAPLGLAVAPDETTVQLSWAPNAEGDLLGYHVYRSDTSGSGYAPLTGSPLPTASFVDAAAVPGTMHYYVVTAVDSSANESGFSEEARGRLVTLDSGILLVDETRDGAGAWFPSDAVADAAYDAALGTLPHDDWDVDVDGIPTLSDLGSYSSVLWIQDDFNTVFQGVLGISQRLAEGVESLSEYMDFGGNVLLTSWEGAKGLVVPFDYPVDPEPGDFLWDYFGVDGITYKKAKAFTGGTGQGIFPDVALDPSRLNPNWDGKLIRAEYLAAIRPDASVGYRFASLDPDSVYHDQPCALYRNGGGYRTIYWGFPLYHLDSGDARAALEAAMTYFGELSSTGATAASPPVAFALARNRPNPFRTETSIVYAVPGEGADVELAIYDIAGRLVRTLVSGRVPGGVHSCLWDGRNAGDRLVASGIYFSRLDAEDRRLTRKLILLR